MHRFCCSYEFFCYSGVLLTGILCCESADFEEKLSQKREIKEHQQFYHRAVPCSEAYTSNESLSHTCRFSCATWKIGRSLVLESVINTCPVWRGSTSSYRLLVFVYTARTRRSLTCYGGKPQRHCLMTKPSIETL